MVRTGSVRVTAASRESRAYRWALLLAPSSDMGLIDFLRKTSADACCAKGSLCQHVLSGEHGGSLPSLPRACCWRPPYRRWSPRKLKLFRQGLPSGQLRLSTNATFLTRGPERAFTTWCCP